MPRVSASPLRSAARYVKAGPVEWIGVALAQSALCPLQAERRIVVRIVNKDFSFSGFGITLFCTVLCAACNSSQSSTHAGGTSGSRHSGTADMLCFSSTDTRKVVVSSVFPVRTYPQERMIEEPWAKDFRRYIGQSGNEGGISVTCLQVSSSDAEKIKAEELRKQGQEVVETKWSYAGG